MRAPRFPDDGSSAEAPQDIRSAPQARIFQIDFGRLEPYECGALLVTLLAHPEPDASEETLWGLFASLCHTYLRALAESDPQWAVEPQAMKPRYAFLDSKVVAKNLKTLKRRLRDRMIAARMGMAFLKEVFEGKPPRMSSELSRLSLNQLSTMVLDDVGADDGSNVESRIWRPSLPVIHLATATALIIDQVEKTLNHSISVGDLVHQPELVRTILATAKTHAQLLQQSKRLTFPPNTLIQLDAIG